MSSALIGHTGLVGSHLDRHFSFVDRYHSRNIESITGKHYERVCCAGVYAVKWQANAQPEADWRGIARLLDALETCRIDELVVISTVDVFGNPVEVDEATVPDPADASAYGRHRLMFEQRLASRFPTRIVRLPGLFGTGLKKNAIFDLLCDHRVDAIPPSAQFQFYPLDRLGRDIDRVRALDLRVVHLATEPVCIGDVARQVFGRELTGASAAAACRYDFRTRHAEALGGKNGYVMDASAVLAAINGFVQRERAR